jgi:hypothetical protein
MAKRFEYKRMTAAEFNSDMEELEMLDGTFGRLFGFEPRRVRQWRAGEEDVPIWVAPVLRVLKAIASAIVEIRQEAAERIIRDNENLGFGEFPYLEHDNGQD